MARLALVSLLLFFPHVATGVAQDVPPDQALQGFLDVLPPYVLDAVPPPLYERSYDWGRQERAFHRVDWNGLKPRIVKTMKNDGTWRKVKVDTRDWPKSLVTKVHDVRKIDAEKMTFKLFVSCPVGID